MTVTGPPWEPQDVTEASAWWRPGEAAIVHVPDGAAGTNGDLVAETAEMMGRPLDPHQRAAVDALSAYRPGGAPLTMEAAIIGPRQTTGKTSAVLLPIVLTDILTRRDDPDRVIWTAHRAFAALEVFKDLKKIIGRSEDIAANVVGISDKDGEEAVDFATGWRIEFRTRSGGAGRSLSAGIVVVDEALYLTSGMAGDLLPTLASRRHPRVLYASSAPKASSAHLHELMRRGRAGDARLTYVEYRSPGTLATLQCGTVSCAHVIDTPGCRLDDPALLRFGNPGMVSGRLGPDTMHTIRAALPPIEFAREMLGFEEAPEGGGSPLTPSAWGRRIDPQSRIADGAARWLAIDTTPERSASAIGGCGRRGDGDWHLALVDHRPGTGWVVDRVVEVVGRQNVAAVLIDRASPAAGFVPDLAHRGLHVRSADHPDGKIVLVGAAEMGQACGKAQDAIAGRDPSAWHRGEQALTTAVEGAARRDIGDGGWALARKRSDVDICPLVAEVLALFGALTVPAYDPVPLVAWR